ncbi:MAG: NifB/NifX family molybdenum-iron cluster-binding protein [Spirochaetes bacterium]|nr:NifB/NifX family molybdenum-iron cluster-binding protein [Spirochaetota bacterium]
MRIAIPTSDRKTVCEHFGRAGYFAVIDSNEKEFTFIDNQINLNAAQGAGIQSSTALINDGVKTVLSPHIGPKAYDVLKSANVKMFLINETDLTLEDAFSKFINNELTEMDGFKK